MSELKLNMAALLLQKFVDSGELTYTQMKDISLNTNLRILVDTKQITIEKAWTMMPPSRNDLTIGEILIHFKYTGYAYFGMGIHQIPHFNMCYRKLIHICRNGYGKHRAPPLAHAILSNICYKLHYTPKPNIYLSEPIIIHANTLSKCIDQLSVSIFRRRYALFLWCQAIYSAGFVSLPKITSDTTFEVYLAQFFGLNQGCKHTIWGRIFRYL